MNSQFKIYFFLVLALFMGNCAGDSICGATNSPDTDADADCIEDSDDNCPNVANSSQADVDSDNVGDECDTDSASFQNTLSTLSIETAPEEPLDTQIVYALEDVLYLCDGPTDEDSIQNTCQILESGDI